MADDATAVFQDAVQQHQTGKFAEAEAGYRKVLSGNPNHPDALHLLGLLAFQTGYPEPGADLIRSAIAERSNVADYYSHLGLCLQGVNDPAEAEKNFRHAIKLASGNGAAHYNLGQFLILSDRHEEAIPYLRRAVSIAPGDPRFQNALGTALAATESAPDAEEYFRAAIEAAPDFSDARQNLSQLLLALGKFDPAEKEVALLLQQNPQDGAAKQILARIFMGRGDYEAAIPIFRDAVSINEGDVGAQVGLGNALIDAGHTQDAVVHYQALLDQEPEKAEVYFNLGLALRAAGKLRDAIEIFNRALDINPDYIDVIYMRGLCQMTIGEFQSGLMDYESRWQNKLHAAAWREFPQPRWRGEDLTDQTLLIWAEQGIGDHLLYAGLVAHLQARGARCLLECDSRLLGVLGRANSELTLVAQDTPPSTDVLDSTIDYQVPMASLFMNLAPSETPFVPTKPYIAVDAARRAEYETLLAARNDNARIGVSWHSSADKMGPKKSLPLSDWSPLFTLSGASFVNLQYGDVEAEINAEITQNDADIFTVPDLDRFDDVEGLAGLIDTLDIVITTSNFTAHIAGALGKECWLLLQLVPFWYWGESGESVPFYPSIHAYRQDTPGEWAPVIDAVSTDLEIWLRRRADGG